MFFNCCDTLCVAPVQCVIAVCVLCRCSASLLFVCCAGAVRHCCLCVVPVQCVIAVWVLCRCSASLLFVCCAGAVRHCFLCVVPVQCVIAVCVLCRCSASLLFVWRYYQLPFFIDIWFTLFTAYVIFQITHYIFMYINYPKYQFFAHKYQNTAPY